MWKGTYNKGPPVYGLSLEDSGSAILTSCIPAACGARVFRKLAVVETAENFVTGKHKPCDNCEKKWPDMINTFFADAFRELTPGCHATSVAAPARGARRRQLRRPSSSAPLSFIAVDVDNCVSLSDAANKSLSACSFRGMVCCITVLVFAPQDTCVL